LQNRTPYEIVTGQTLDILEYLDYHWYQNFWCLDQEAKFPEDCRKLGKWIGVTHRVGQALCYFVMPPSARPIVQSTIQALYADELSSPEVKVLIQEQFNQVQDHHC
jgi:hypothetical protein